jgi:hypothetical protein
MNTPQDGGSGPEKPAIVYGITAGLWPIPAAALAALVIKHEQWDPSADTTTNVVRGIMAIGLAGMAVYDWYKFNQAIDS